MFWPPRRSDRRSPLAAVGRAAAAGALGTLAMTAWQALAARLQPRSDEPESEDPWENAPVPAQAARRVGAGLLGWEPSPERIPLLTNAMHWGYGTGWAVPYGLWARTRGSVKPPLAGAAFGAAVWGMSYVQLVPMGLYEPPWRYPVKELALDLSYHLVYGIGTASAFAVLGRVAS